MKIFTAGKTARSLLWYTMSKFFKGMDPLAVFPRQRLQFMNVPMTTLFHKVEVFLQVTAVITRQIHIAFIAVLMQKTLYEPIASKQ